MKRMTWLLLLPLTSLIAEPVCPKCERIREYNKDHPGFDGYYEDYMKHEKKSAPPSENPPAENPSAEKTPDAKTATDK